MAITKFSNNAATTLVTAVNDSLSSKFIYFNPADETKFPVAVLGASYFYLTLITPSTHSEWEIVKVNYISTTGGGTRFFYVDRAQQGTTAKNWKVGTIIIQYVTAGDTENFLQEKEMVNGHVHPPVGTIMPWTSTTAPADYLLCNGASYQRTDYPYLFDFIGTTYGANNTTTFKVPDLRGLFVRGLNTTSSGYDPNRSLGTVQTDGFMLHNHELNQAFNPTGSAASPFTGTWKVKNYTKSPPDSPVNVYSTGGAETRPYNIALPYIIRATF